MKSVDLNKGQFSLKDLLALAKSGTVMIHSESGEDFILEQADDFEREIAALGASDKFLSFLEGRARETERMPLEDIFKKRGF